VTTRPDDPRDDRLRPEPGPRGRSRFGRSRIRAVASPLGCVALSIAVVACAGAVDDAAIDDRVAAGVRAATAPLEERVAELERERDELAETVRELAAENGRLGESLAVMEASSERIEDEMMELYDDAIYQVVETRDSLGEQISRVLERLAREKMDEMVGRDAGELDRMLAAGGVDLDREGCEALAAGGDRPAREVVDRARHAQSIGLGPRSVPVKNPRRPDYLYSVRVFGSVRSGSDPQRVEPAVHINVLARDPRGQLRGEVDGRLAHIRSLDRAAQRVYREALAWTVLGQSPAVRGATLARLTQRPG